jgi:hypothetical protein
MGRWGEPEEIHDPLDSEYRLHFGLSECKGSKIQVVITGALVSTSLLKSRYGQNSNYPNRTVRAY